MKGERRGGGGWAAIDARFVVALAVPLAVGVLSGLATARGVSEWYPGLAKPAFTPPDWLFGPAWTVLYLLMGLAAWLVWRRRDEARVGVPLLLFTAQLLLNGLWSVLFFGLRSPGAAAVEILVLWVAIGVTIRAFHRVSVPAAVLLAPYWAWVTFAAILNLTIWMMNR
jgi:tryptophan-rich sensory protein